MTVLVVEGIVYTVALKGLLCHDVGLTVWILTVLWYYELRCQSISWTRGFVEDSSRQYVYSLAAHSPKPQHWSPSLMHLELPGLWG